MSKIDFKDFVANKKAEFVEFDNSVAAIPNNPTNVQDAIKELAQIALVQFVPFQFLGTANFDRYIYSGSQITTRDLVPSGNVNGFRFNNCAPSQAGFTGKVKSATATIAGLAVSTGTKAANMELKFELWKVGWTNEGTKLGDVIFNIESSSYPNIGLWWNASPVAAFQSKQAQDINVTAGDLLALKFKRETGNDKIVAIREVIINLEVQVG